MELMSRRPKGLQGTKMHLVKRWCTNALAAGTSAQAADRKAPGLYMKEIQLLIFDCPRGRPLSGFSLGMEVLGQGVYALLPH